MKKMCIQELQNIWGNVKVSLRMETIAALTNYSINRFHYVLSIMQFFVGSLTISADHITVYS